MTLSPQIQALLPLFCIAFCTLALKQYYLNIRKDNPQGLPPPPGPKPWPIIGNMFDAPHTSPWIAFQKWGLIYGDIVSFRVFSQTFVVINSREIAFDLLEMRSRNYSDRPDVPLLKMSGWDFNFVTMRYGPKWRAHRRLFNEKFRADAAVSYQPAQLNSAYTLLRGILKNPNDFVECLKTFSASIVMYTMYGHQISPRKDRFVEIAEESANVLSLLMSPSRKGSTLLPLLRYLPSWFPGAGFKRTTERSKMLTAEMTDGPFNFVKKNMASGLEVPSLTSELLEKHKVAGGSQEEETVIKNVASVAYAAGVATTTAAILSTILAMILYPEAQKKAQEEINRVIGSGRLPDYADREKLPYVEAFYREAMRWHPTTPLPPWHTTIESDVYDGMFIPKGAFVVPNIWAMTHNDRVYPNPNEFRPERFLSDEGQLNEDSHNLTFSIGRRMCPGRFMASSTIWGAMTCILAAFDIAKAKDELGNEIDVEPIFEGIVFRQPVPFKCSITPRSEDAGRLVRETTPLVSARAT